MKNELKKSETKEGIKAGFASGFLASLCCVGPLIIVLLGLGSVSFALSISQYRIYFVGFGLLFMLGAIGLHLRKRTKTCDMNYFSADGLKKEKTFIISVIVSMIAIYLIAIYVIVPLIGPTIYGKATVKSKQSISLDSLYSTDNQKTVDKNILTEKSKEELKQKIINTKPNSHILKVEISNMTCTSCSSGVQSLLESLDGVMFAEVSYAKKTGEIIYDPNIITKEEIINSDAFSIYPGIIIKDEKITKSL